MFVEMDACPFDTDCEGELTEKDCPDGMLACDTCGERVAVDYDEYCDDYLDGDHESALASAGFGTDEDYGDFGGGFFEDF